VTFELGRSLLLADAIAPDALASALLLVATKGVCLPRALVTMEAVELPRLEEELARVEVPVLRHVVPLVELVELLPPGLCDALMAVPLRRDPRTGTVDVAVVDARDAHAADEIAYWLEAPVRVLRTSYAAMDAALARMRPQAPGEKVKALAPPIWVPVAKHVREVAETPMYGSPMMDEKTAQALLEGRDEIPIPLRKDIPIPLTQSRERTASAHELPEPVVDLVHPKPPSSRPDPHALSSAVATSAARILAEERSPHSRAPVTARGPFAASAPVAPFSDMGAVLEAMREAPDRDHVIEILLESMRAVARRVGIFVVKQGAFVGWACTTELSDVDTLRALKVPIGAPTVLARALDAGAPVLARLEATAANVALAAALRVPPEEAAVAAIRIDGKPVLVVFADGLTNETAAMKRLGELTRAAADALTRILMERRR
jgi:hypothetical protein